MGALRTITAYLRELGIDEHDFFRDVPDQFKRIETMITEELVKPTASLSDLMYKSVDIRDSRFSLQLGTSMWRLSWVTFAFLPLTFLTGFFGMNVTTFQNSAGYPSIWWSVYPPRPVPLVDKI
jgi:Mg2+ and Co2+ transporter CorA